AAKEARYTLAVLSPAFLESPYCDAEWAAAFRSDPTGRERKLVPVRVRECEPEGLLGPIVYADLVGLSDTAARAELLSAVRMKRGKPANPPAFPSGAQDRHGGHSPRVVRPEPGAAIFSVPVGTRMFAGRQKMLERLGTGLADSGTVAVTQVHAIHGMGGVGKTQLAARYAREHRADYDVVWWVRAEQPQTLGRDLAQLAVRLGLVDEVDFDEPGGIAAAREWLERNPSLAGGVR
ncbi:MAG: TIR domain-containing protein, partial [Actinobacteria bacterium]|nr:TIR domain-containing protein [Actinomycetota bacterium]